MSLKSASRFIVLLVAFLGFAMGAAAQDLPITVHSNEFANITISGSGKVYADAEVAFWIETPYTPPDSEWIYVRAYLEVDGNVVAWSGPIDEGDPNVFPWVNHTFSRDPDNQDILPIAWQYQLTPGPHTVRFYAYVIYDGGLYGYGFWGGDLFDIQTTRP